MDPRTIARALRAGWWIVTIALVLGAGAGLLVSALTTPLYTARTQLFVSTTETGSTLDAFQGSQFSQQRAASYAQLLSGEELASRVIADMDIDASPDDLAERVTATVLPETVLLEVTVTHPTATTARDIAAVLGEQFIALVAELETPAGAEQSPVKVTVVDRPEVPEEASTPQAPRNMAVGMAAGLLAGAAVAVGRVAWDRSVRDPAQIWDLVGVPVIGTVIRDESLARQHVVHRSVGSRTAEDFRQIRTNLQFLSVDNPPRVIMVSSPLPSEGKTTLAINLALLLADAGHKVVLVEADLRRPRITHYMGLVSGAGVTSVLAGSADIDEVLQTYGTAGPSVLAAGPLPPNPGELLGSSHMSELLGKLRATSDYVIVDAPPILPVADTAGLAPRVDGVLLSVRYGTTRRDQLVEAASTLERVGSRTLGVVINIVPPRAGLAVARGYGYKYEERGGAHSA